MYQIQTINDKREKKKKKGKKQHRDKWEETQEKQNISTEVALHIKAQQRERESVTKRQKDRGKWVGMSPFILPPLPPSTPVKSHHYMCRLMSDKLVQQHVIVNCKCVRA